MKNTKLAYFLRGLGFGIVFVTAILMISGRTSSKTKTVTETKELSKEEIIAKAKEYGMVEGVGMKVDQLLDATATPEPTAIPEDAVSKAEKPEKEDAQSDASEEQSEGVKEFTVKSGQTAGQVSKALEKQGLVDDAEKFHQYLDENGYSTKIIATKHKISLNGAYETIAKQLCEYNK